MLLRKAYYLQKVMKQEWLSREELRKLQEKGLRAIIKHAYQNSPFYHQLFRSLEIRPGDIKRLEDLEKLPIVTKDEVKKNYQKFIARNYKVFFQRCTSGSTGAPFTMSFDERAWDYIEAIYARSWFGIGYKPWERIAYYWHEPLRKKLFNYLGLMRKYWISNHLSEEEQIDLMLKLRCKVICHFPSIIYSIAKKIKKEGIELKAKIVFTHGEVLSSKMRKVIEETFDCRVYDRYGSAEFLIMASECKERVGYHVNEDSLVLEILRDGEEVSSGERGEVVVTGLANYLFPLIRYKIGDIAIPSDETCPCGRELSLLKSIEGRGKDFIVLKSGRLFTPKEIIDSIADISEIYKFRVNYKGRNRFLIEVVLFDGGKILEKIEQRLKELLKEEVKIKFKVVDEIIKTKGGKRGMVISS
jgi:phenylacetate-CoA ligase